MVDIKYGSDEAATFVTNVGLITSKGPNGDNIMSAEWTRLISYSPAIIMINIHKSNATAENISFSNEFGVNIAAENQSVITSVSGKNTGKEVDKVSALKALGFEFYKANKIDVLMVSGASLNLECKLVKKEEIGDHVMMIGEVLEMHLNKESTPLIFRSGKYYKVGERILKPAAEILEKIDKVVKDNAKKK